MPNLRRALELPLMHSDIHAAVQPIDNRVSMRIVDIRIVRAHHGQLVRVRNSVGWNRAHSLGVSNVPLAVGTLLERGVGRGREDVVGEALVQALAIRVAKGDGAVAADGC